MSCPIWVLKKNTKFWTLRRWNALSLEGISWIQQIQLNGEQTVPTNKDGDMRFLKMMEEYIWNNPELSSLFKIGLYKYIYIFNLGELDFVYV